MGRKLGRHWTKHDATPEQILRVNRFDDGKNWVENRTEPAIEFMSVVAPDKPDFMGTGDIPPPSFVAGFIDGVKSTESS